MSTFFKVVLQQSLQDQKLMLPPKFVRKFGRNLPNFAFFELPNGEIWKLRLQKTNGKVWLHEGWADFANYHTLKHGNFLVCTYDENDKFHVGIFGLNGMEIDYPPNPAHHHYDSSSTSSEQEETSDESEASNQSLDDDFPTYPNTIKSAEQKKKKHKTTETRPKSATNKKFTQGHGQVVSKLLEKVEAIRKKETSECKKPFFVVGVQPAYIRGKYMYVPNTFIDEHLEHQFINIDLHTSDGRTWPVVLKPKPRQRISVGWANFQKDNNLKVGDVVVFELVKKNPFSFQVRIY